jgi:hypothetical protein
MLAEYESPEILKHWLEYQSHKLWLIIMWFRDGPGDGWSVKPGFPPAKVIWGILGEVCSMKGLSLKEASMASMQVR